MRVSKSNLFVISITLLLITSIFSCKKRDPFAGTDNAANTDAVITSLGCNTTSFSVTAATVNQVYTGTATVPYSGGNGRSFAAGVAIQSTGVTGMTATLNSGTLNSGNGNITFSISGTPATIGEIGRAHV